MLDFSPDLYIRLRHKAVIGRNCVYGQQTTQYLNNPVQAPSEVQITSGSAGVWAPPREGYACHVTATSVVLGFSDLSGDPPTPLYSFLNAPPPPPLSPRYFPSS